jgi:hypothetical protein
VVRVSSSSHSAHDAPPALGLEQLARGLKNPVYLTHDGTPGASSSSSPARFASSTRPAVLQRTPYLDITKRVDFGGECGLLSVAFHPKFAENGYLYVDYTIKRGPQRQSIIARLHGREGRGRQSSVDPVSS